MNLDYSLSHQDYLNYQLYTASKSKIIQKQKRLTYVWILIVIVFLSVNTYNKFENSLPYLISGSILFFIAIYILLNRYYRHYFSKFIDVNYKSRIDQLTEYHFTKDQVIATNSLGEYKIYYNSFKQINEITDYYFLKLKSEESFIIPKNKIDDKIEFAELINYLKNEYNLEHYIDFNWKV